AVVLQPGPLLLMQGVYLRICDGRLGGRRPALRIRTHSDAPPGSGLGSSSTLVTALVGLIRSWLREPLGNYEIAELSYRIERTDLAIPGGRQDPYAATFGGFNWIEFHRDHTIVNPLRIRRDVVNELEYSLLLCYSGASRLSASIVESQTRSFIDGNPLVVRSLDRMKDLASEMKAALLRDRVRRFGELLREAWIAKKDLDPGITNERIDRLHEAAIASGAIGGKLLGAGGGGFLLLFCPFERRQPVERALEAEGGRIVPFALEDRGLQTWIVPPENGESA
ncbi:MAG: hypothetical protein QUU85_00810, partial [Candidatus Eisenbacteria bacterium]|nr:hypothetical protein [Candidatus Eisenbacteria bacterium]